MVDQKQPPYLLGKDQRFQNRDVSGRQLGRRAYQARRLLYLQQRSQPGKTDRGPRAGTAAGSPSRSQTGFDITVEERRFFDYWLKGIDNGIMDEDRVYYYTYNAPAGSEWRSARQWPLPNEKRIRYYLGEGSLSTAEPTGVDQKDETTVAYDVTPDTMTTKGLVYETAPLSADVQITGHPAINLWISSTATDGDFIATIQDVAPDGTATSYNVHGRLRASLRKLQDAPYNNLGLPWHGFYQEDVTPLVPGQPAELQFDILPISMIFKAGHRIRLVVEFRRPGNAQARSRAEGCDISRFKPQVLSYVADHRSAMIRIEIKRKFGMSGKIQIGAQAVCNRFASVD